MDGARSRPAPVWRCQRRIKGTVATSKAADLSRYERIPGRTERLEIGGDTARMMALVDGHRAVHDIADVLKESVPSQPVEETMSAFARYFDRGLLSWRKRGR
jgi:hypothetical protein